MEGYAGAPAEDDTGQGAPETDPDAEIEGQTFELDGHTFDDEEVGQTFDEEDGQMPELDDGTAADDEDPEAIGRRA